MDKIRIGYDLRWQTGSLVHYVRNLLKALVARGNEKFQFVCYSQGTDSQSVAELDGSGRYEGSLVSLQPGWSSRLPRLLRKDRIQLFHSPFYMMPFFSHVPAIITIHDVIPFLRYTDKRGIDKMVICALNDWLRTGHQQSSLSPRCRRRI